MADGGGGDKKFANFLRDASALLKGRKNADGKGSTAGNRSALGSAMMKGNAAKRNALLAKFGAAYGVPAAAGAGAGAAVAAAVAGGPGPINSANKKAAQAALAAAIAAGGSARLPQAPHIAKYARLMKNGKNAEAANYLGKVVAAAVEKNAEKGAKAAAAAAAKTLKKEKNSPSTNEEIKKRLSAAGAPKGVVNIAVYRKARIAGQNVVAAINAVKQSRKNAVIKAGATRTAKALAKKAAAASAAAGGAGAAAAAPIVAAAKAAKAVGETGTGKAAKKNGPNSSNMTHRAPRGAAARPGSVLAGLMRRSSRRTRRRRN